MTEPSSDTEIVLTLLGPPKWRHADGRSGSFKRKDALLLAVLTLAGEQPRDRMAAWLWPHAAHQQATVALRQRLFKLRQTLGHPLVVAGQTLMLAPGVAADDIRTTPPAAGELLGGFDYGDLDAADAWVEAERLQLQQRRLDWRVGEAARLEAAGTWAAAIDLCETILIDVPSHEHTWRRLMRLHFLRGDRSSAVHTFQKMASTVLAEQGGQASAETLELLRAIEAMDPPRPARAQRHALPASLMRPPRLVGRAATLQALQQAWASDRAVLVLGSGGLGKTRLLDEFMRSHTDTVQAVHTRARPGDASMPYASIGPLLHKALQRFQPALEPGQQNELARLLPGLGEAPKGLGHQAPLWQAVEAVLAQCLGAGLNALVIDDLHHADLASLELLRWLYSSADLSRLHFVFAARPDEPGPAAVVLQSWGGDSTRLELLPLAPLTVDELGQLLDSLQLDALHADALNPDTAVAASNTFAQALHRHTGGNPFFSLETVKATWLRDSGDGSADRTNDRTNDRKSDGTNDGTIDGTNDRKSDRKSDRKIEGTNDGAATGGTTLALPVPLSALTMLQRRLASLSEPALELLRLAAVATTDLDADVVAQILQRPVLSLANAWAELEAAQIMQGAAFAHDLVQESALLAVPMAVRQALHGQLAKVLQARADTKASRLAYHWWQAGEWPSAAAALQTAAQAARVAGRLQEQEQLLEQAGQAHQKSGNLRASFGARCEAMSAAMMRLGSEAALPRLTQLVHAAHTDEERARALALQAEAWLNLARYGQALAAAQAAQGHAAPGSAAAFDAASLYGRALALNGQPAPAVALLQQACANALGLDDAARQLVAQSALAHAQFAAGQTGAAVASQHQAFVLAEQLGDVAEMAQTAGNLATLASVAGDTPTAYRFAAEAERRFHAMGADDGHGVFNRLILARSAAHLGHLDKALPLLQAATQQSAGHAGITSLTLARVALGVLQLWLGLPDAVLRSLPPHDPGMHPLAGGSVQLLKARAQRLMGINPRAACQAFDALADQHAELADNPVLTLEWARFAEHEAALHRLRRLRQQAQAAGADGMARSLALRELAVLLDSDAAAASTLALQLLPQLDPGLGSRPHASLDPTKPSSLYPSTYPPEAWWTLALALQTCAPDSAQHCRDKARRWIEQARLPAPETQWRAAFMTANPVNRVVLAAAR